MRWTHFSMTLKMRINDIVNKYYDHFLGLCTRKDTAIYGGKTSEDLLGEAVLTALNKFKDMEIEEQEGYDYLQKTFLESCLFAWKKKCGPEEKMIEYIENYNGCD